MPALYGTSNACRGSMGRPATASTAAGQGPPLSRGADVAQSIDVAHEALIRLSAIRRNANHALRGELPLEAVLLNIIAHATTAEQALEEAGHA